MTHDTDQIDNEISALLEGIAHALRTPTWTIHEFSRMLEEDARDCLNASCRDYLQQIRLGTGRLNALTKGISDYAASCQGELQPATINLSAMIIAIGDDLQAAWGSPVTRLIVEPDITVLADAALMDAAMRHLMGNAWKFTRSRETPEIRFLREESADDQVYRLEDNGIGFDPSLTYKLFRPFQRLHAQPEYDGLGMGLSITRRIIHRHGGAIRAESVPGQGSCFMFTLKRGID